MDILNSICLAILEPWKRAFDFGGRSRRREYFVFYIQFFVVICSIVWACEPPSTDTTFDFNKIPLVAQIVLYVYVAISIIPGLSLQIRRLHDSNRSGWWFWLNVIPYLGHFFLLLLMLAGGTAGDNRFGKNPRIGSPAT